ncbi:MAG: YitT family protein [Lachnospiraceae bacterium]|nr:YitT family protein [Lachnospiraceae bacterium]
MKLLNKKPVYVNYILIILGSGLIAMSVQCLYDPCGMVTGGFTGIAIIIKMATSSIIEGGVPLWLTNILLNAPVFIIAYFIKGKRFIGRTTFATIMLSAWLYVIPAVDLAQGDFMLASIFGAVIAGAGMGFILLAKATTGGTDMVAVLIHHKLRHYSVVRLLLLVDGAVVVAGLYAFGLQAGLYAIIAIYITSKVSDALMEGMKYAKAAFIITDRHEQVADALMSTLDRGVTGIYAKGMYSGTDKCMLYCVVSKKEIVELKDIVVKIDKNAFVIVSDAIEVLGEGFIEYHKK